MIRRIRDNSLSIFFLAIFLAALFAQSVAGHRTFNEQRRAHDAETFSYARYLYSSDFGQAVMENWQSEYLQFALFALATVWLVQRGSAESKPPGDAGLESDEQQLVGPHAKRSSPSWARAGGWRSAFYGNSLLIVMLAIFLGSWLAQSITAWNVYNDDQSEHGEQVVAWAEYLQRADFWESTLQNWQSEFLAVGSMAVFTVYLRQRGSPESKPVGEAHETTASSD